MIRPTEEDVGRQVIYDDDNGTREYGVITSMNTYFVFVRYGPGETSQATKREDLEWA